MNPASLSLTYVAQRLSVEQLKRVKHVPITDLRPGILIICRYIEDGIILDEIVFAIVVSIESPKSNYTSFARISITLLTMNNELVTIRRWASLKAVTL